MKVTEAVGKTWARGMSVILGQDRNRARNVHIAQASQGNDMTYFNDSSYGAAKAYCLSISETFVSNFSDTISIAANDTVSVAFENTLFESQLTPVFNISPSDTVYFAEGTSNPSFVTDAKVNVTAEAYLRFSDDGKDTVSVHGGSSSPSDNLLTFNGPSDVLYDSGADDFVKQGWESGNSLTGALLYGDNDTIDGGLGTSISMLFENYGINNNLFLAPGHTGTTSITIVGGLRPLDGQSWSGYTIENVNPAQDQFNIGTATILGETVAGGNTYIDISGGVDLVFKGYTGPADALFVGYH